MCVRSLGSLQGVPNPRLAPATGTLLLNRDEIPVLFVSQELPSVSPDSKLLPSLTRAQCLLFESPKGTLCSKVGGHSQSYSTRHLSGTRLHRDQTRCANTNTHRYAAVQQNRSESPTVTARIHSLSGIGSVQRITTPLFQLECRLCLCIYHRIERIESLHNWIINHYCEKYSHNSRWQYDQCLYPKPH